MAWENTFGPKATRRTVINLSNIFIRLFHRCYDCFCHNESSIGIICICRFLKYALKVLQEIFSAGKDSPILNVSFCICDISVYSKLCSNKKNCKKSWSSDYFIKLINKKSF